MAAHAAGHFSLRSTNDTEDDDMAELRKDKVSGWRWFLGAWGVGTYRQDDSVDVRYERADGSPAVAEGLEIEPG